MRLSHTAPAVTALVAIATLTGTTTPAAADEASLVPATDRAITFVVAGTTTYGTLHIPAHRPGQRLAAALLLPGSGPTDRNGDQLPTFDPNTLALITGVFGDEGVMTLRFDKYFSGQTGGGTFAADPGRFDLADQINQADAAYRVLRDQPETDRRRMLIAGHSEGGMTAVLVAESVSPRPAGLALVEPQDERLLDLIDIQLDEQLTAAVAAGQLTEDVAQTNRVGIRRVIAEFRAGQPIDTTGLLPVVADFFTQAVFSADNARYTRSDDRVYPPARAAELPRDTKVLVTDGTADSNVPPSTTPALVAALRRAHVGGPGLVTLPDTDHLLHLAGTPQNDQVLDAAATTALRAFADEFGTARP
jgi:hypothetical protein